jgi:glycine betaine/choline ABC-type transport system substrate-binding protein
VLALVLDFCIGTVEVLLRPGRRSGTAKRRAVATLAVLALFSLAVFLFLAGQGGVQGTFSPDRRPRLRIGTKNFTEQLILGELLAQQIETAAGLEIDRRFNLGGTILCHRALANGEIDLYPEYTGTALTAILEQEKEADPEACFALVAKAYRERFSCKWFSPFGFNSTYAITVRSRDAVREGWSKISDLEQKALKLEAGFTAEFSERPDGYPGLRQAYGFAFGKVFDLDPGLMYKAVSQGEVDVICAFSTDGRIEAYDLAALTDDRNFFPPYYAAPVVRVKALEVYPGLRDALAPLAGLISEGTMQRLNFDVDEKGRSPEEVAREFLRHNVASRPSLQIHRNR